MAGFETWDVIKVPFPYTDRPVRQRRPALVVAAGELERSHGLLWVVMITSAENRSWPEDVGVSDLVTAACRRPRWCARRRSRPSRPATPSASAPCRAPTGGRSRGSSGRSSRRPSARIDEAGGRRRSSRAGYENDDAGNYVLCPRILIRERKAWRMFTLKRAPKDARRGAISTIMSSKTMRTACSIPPKRSEKQSIGRKVRATLLLSLASGT